MNEQKDENEQACRCAAERAAHDMPYVEVGEARLYKKVETYGAPGLSVQGVRWYVEVDVRHWDPDEGAAVALYRVWPRLDGSMAAIKVDIREKVEEGQTDERTD